MRYGGQYLVSRWLSGDSRKRCVSSTVKIFGFSLENVSAGVSSKVHYTKRRGSPQLDVGALKGKTELIVVTWRQYTSRQPCTVADVGTT